MLSDLGAEVIKVERPPGGDPHRNFGAVIPNEGKRFQAVNRGKRSILVDLQTTAGRELIQRILPSFDVLTINFRQRVLERLGIDYETLSALHPGLVYCRISAFGSRGPLADRAGTDATMSAYSGLTVGDAKVDEAGAPEHISSGPVSDYTSGLAAVIGHLLGALPPRHHGSRPARRDLAAAFGDGDSGQLHHARAGQRRGDPRAR